LRWMLENKIEVIPAYADESNEIKTIFVFSLLPTLKNNKDADIKADKRESMYSSLNKDIRFELNSFILNSLYQHNKWCI